MKKEIKTVAFDLGGVLAYQDLSVLTDLELILFQTYMNRNKNVDSEVLKMAESKIAEIYLKIHRLNSKAIQTLDMLRQDKIKASIWTNNIREINDWFEEIGLYNYINREDVINSFYLGFDKPDLRFYYQALRQLNNCSQSVLFFDDNATNVINARYCGINSNIYFMHQDLEEIVDMELRRVK